MFVCSRASASQSREKACRWGPLVLLPQGSLGGVPLALKTTTTLHIITACSCFLANNPLATERKRVSHSLQGGGRARCC
ncbi:hypothetical protein XELAEV_18003880mg [Xenopus laevis]|nr:hypothetical protein XELAEV_18003880mg [Xenopus laevis]